MPAARQTLQRPSARRAFRHHHAAGLDRVQDPAAVEHRVGGLERIVVTRSDMPLEMFKLAAEVDFDLGPGGYGDDLARLVAIQGHVLSCVPVCSMNGPGSVTPPFAKGVTRHLPSTGVVGKDVPRIPVDALFAADHGVGLIDTPPGLITRWVSKDRVRIEVSRATRPVGKGRSAMCPQRDEIVAEEDVQLVAETKPRCPRSFRNFVKRDAQRQSPRVQRESAWVASRPCAIVQLSTTRSMLRSTRGSVPPCRGYAPGASGWPLGGPWVAVLVRGSVSKIVGHRREGAASGD